LALDPALLRSSFDLVVERQPLLTARFYQLLFERHPNARALFHRRPLEAQERMLQEALVAVLDHLEDAAWLSDTLGGMGSQHREHGVTDEMYDWVGDALLAALAEAAGADWSPELHSAWSAAYGAVAGLMKDGAAVARGSARPS
jgi:hemoglobin-like flavoprotein